MARERRELPPGTSIEYKQLSGFPSNMERELKAIQLDRRGKKQTQTKTKNVKNWLKHHAHVYADVAYGKPGVQLPHACMDEAPLTRQIYIYIYISLNVTAVQL